MEKELEYLHRTLSEMSKNSTDRATHILLLQCIDSVNRIREGIENAG